ncbi:MAG: efflux RND transporter periplasmic adaptor subunit [Paracoccaceae bacterium]|nr:efflux RND transporter periplasmic adaptor subunit [Paracoccaceae bacterium]
MLRIESSVTLPRRFTGQFEAAQEVALGFEEGGTIEAVWVREGDAVHAGTIIARLDTRLLDAERTRLLASQAALAAQAELARRTNDRQAALVAEGHVTQQRLDETSLQLAQLEASLSEIDAAIAALDVRISKTVIRAPFAGRIGARLLDDGAVAGPGAGVVTLLEAGPARFRVAVDPELAARLLPNSEVEIDTSGRALSARLAELAPELDPATRNQIAYFDLLPSTSAPPARTTGEVILPDTQSEIGVWVPLSALRRGPRGAWTLLTVTKDDHGIATVGQEAAEVLHLDESRAFVRGSFSDGTLYLPGGTHRVVPGEAVRLAEAG